MAQRKSIMTGSIVVLATLLMFALTPSTSLAGGRSWGGGHGWGGGRSWGGGHGWGGSNFNGTLTSFVSVGTCHTSFNASPDSAPAPPASGSRTLPSLIPSRREKLRFSSTVSFPIPLTRLLRTSERP